MPQAKQPTFGIRAIGRAALDRVAHVGAFGVFAMRTVRAIPSLVGTTRGWRTLLPQCYHIGAMSVPVIVVTGLFVGMVLVVQGWGQFDAAGMADRLAGVVNMSVAAELGPVLAGVMLAGRVGGALTAEIGTMNVTEQLLALRALGVSPIRYLVAPRFLACLLLAPVLTCYANLTGALGGWLIFSGVYGGDSHTFWQNTRDVVQYWDLGTGLLKAFLFGGAIGLISCHHGFHCDRGAQGVGRACTTSFVTCFIAILLIDLAVNIPINQLYVLWYGPRSLI